MFERLISALAIGLPLGVLSALISAPLARELSGRLMVQYATTKGPSASVSLYDFKTKKYLDRLLLGGLCACHVLAVLNWGVSWHAWMAALYCVTLQVLARIDAQTHLLPDVLTLPLLWAGLLFHWSGGWVPLDDAVAGAAAGYAVLWVIWVAFRGCSGRDGIGFGDLKLAAANGAWLGIEALPWALLAASLAACVVALFGRATGRLKQYEAVAFGPYLAMGAILVLFCTQNSLSSLSFESLASLLAR